MKTILSFIDWYAPGYKAGGTVRSFQNMISFLKEDYKFCIVTRNTDYTETEPYEGIASDTWIRVEENVHVYYASAGQVNLKNWKKILREVSYDAVYIHGVFSSWFSVLPLYLNQKGARKKTIVAAHGMFGDHAFQVKPLKKNVFLRFIRASNLYRDVVFHAANADEAADIRKRLGSKASVVIANELPMKDGLKGIVPLSKVSGKLKLMFLGRISEEKNLKYGLELLEEFLDGEIELDIFGPVYNKEYWRECQAIIERLPVGITVRYQGSLNSERVMEKLVKYHALFSPTTGENFGHAILESLMASRPVIISDRTPWKNLEEFGAGFDLPLEDRHAFRAAIGTLLTCGQSEFNSLTESTADYISNYINSPEGLHDNIQLFKS